MFFLVHGVLIFQQPENFRVVVNDPIWLIFSKWVETTNLENFCCLDDFFFGCGAFKYSQNMLRQTFGLSRST